MTCREKLEKERPEHVGQEHMGGCFGCPHGYGYLPRPSYCNGGRDSECYKCWDREIPDNENWVEPTIKDSGDRTEFATGAVRDIQKGKGRCDLLPLDVVSDMYMMQNGRDCHQQMVF